MSQVPNSSGHIICQSRTIRRSETIRIESEPSADMVPRVLLAPDPVVGRTCAINEKHLQQAS